LPGGATQECRDIGTLAAVGGRMASYGSAGSARGRVVRQVEAGGQVEVFGQVVILSVDARTLTVMGLREELDERFATSTWAHDAQEISKSGPDLTHDESLTLISETLGGILYGFGDLVDAILEIAGHIDAIEARGK
jgi:hypothetical protein